MILLLWVFVYYLGEGKNGGRKSEAQTDKEGNGGGKKE